ncbi:MAG: ABC transporter ATP-binding protein [Syntrophobacteraceae bacterium]
MSENKILIDNVTVEYRNGGNARKPWNLFGKGRSCGSAGDDVRTVLHDINIEIKTGEFVSVLGHSGCGKSTLLKVIAGFVRPTRGAVLIDGKEVTKPQPDHVFVFQEGSLFPWLTIRENISLALRPVKDPREKEEKAAYYLELVGLENSHSQYPYMLSGGMRQRAEIARAIAAQPDILLMDEPFSALDYLTRLNLREEMLYLHVMLPKTTILFVTHDIDEALQLCNRLIIMSDPPSQVKCCRTIKAPHPRNLTDIELSDLRSHIYYHLGVHTAV